MTLTLTISGKHVESVELNKHKNLTEGQIIAYLKNKYVDRILREPWEMVITVMSKMHRVHISDYTIRKHIKDEPPKPLVRPAAHYSNRQFNQAS